MEFNEQFVRANGVDLCVQTFGQPADPAILLIHGAAASMLWWDEEFCERLAAGSRFVIRYDHRDTGRSVSYEPGAPPYTGRDLDEDPVGLLDAFGLSSAHFVGLSMGGGIAQSVALEHPDRVASLTLIATSPVSRRPDGPDLPPPSEEYRAYTSGAQSPDWSDRAAVIDYLVEAMRVLSGGSADFDEAAARDLAGRDVDRTVNIASSQLNHFAIDEGDPIRARLDELRVPTLVIHGAMDPMFPPAMASRWRRRSPAPGCSYWIGWATSCRGRSGTSSSPPSWSTRRAEGAARCDRRHRLRHRHRCTLCRFLNLDWTGGSNSLQWCRMTFNRCVEIAEPRSSFK